MRGIKNLSLGLGIKHERGDGKSRVAGSKGGMKNFQKLNLQLEDGQEDFPIAEEYEGEHDAEVNEAEGLVEGL